MQQLIFSIAWIASLSHYTLINTQTESRHPGNHRTLPGESMGHQETSLGSPRTPCVRGTDCDRLTVQTTVVGLTMSLYMIIHINNQHRPPYSGGPVFSCCAVPLDRGCGSPGSYRAHFNGRLA